MTEGERTDSDGPERAASRGREPHRDEATDGDDGGTNEGNADERPDHLDDVRDGCGCAEMWERAHEYRTGGE